MAKSNNGKIIKTTLDDLDYGSADASEGFGKVGKPRIPDGVTSSMLTRDILLIAWPSLVELILTQLTSMADQIMVGRLPGTEGVMALSAVGLATQPKFLLMTMIQAMNVGTTALVARFRGQMNRKMANQVFSQTLLLNFIISAIFMVVGVVFSENLVRFMSGNGISAETMALGVQYLDIQLYGFVPLCLSFTMTAALRGIGDTRTPMVYNTVANVINLFFNYVMIYGKLGCPKLGVAGASIATVIGQTVAFVIAVVVILGKKRYVYIDFKEKFTFNKGLMMNVINIGIPSMIEQLFMRAGLIIYTRTVAGLGDTMYATHQVCMNIQSMSFMMGQAFANSATTLMGQSLGKRRYDMAECYMKQTRKIGILVSFVLAAVLIGLNRQIIALYNKTPEVIAMGSQILFLLAFSQPFQADQFITAGGLRGAGDTRFTAMVMAITVLGVRSGLGYVAVNVLDWNLWGAWIALIADQLCRTFLMAYRYKGGKWKEIATNRFKGM